MNYPMLDDGTRDWCITCTHNVNGACELMLDCTYQSDENGLDYDKAPTKYKEKPMTNADRFRSMSDEELAEYFPTHASLCPDLEENKTMCKGANFMADDKMCQQCWLDWLKQEANEKESAGA